MQFIQKTNDKFLQELKDKDIIYTPLEEYKKYFGKIAWECLRMVRRWVDVKKKVCVYKTKLSE